MTEKYTHTYFGAILKDGELFAYAESEINAKSICKELNKKDKRIKELEKENNALKEIKKEITYESKDECIYEW